MTLNGGVDVRGHGRLCFPKMAMAIFTVLHILIEPWHSLDILIEPWHFPYLIPRYKNHTIHLRMLCRLTSAKCLAQSLAHPKHLYCLCVFDALPYHLWSLTSPTEVYLVTTVNIYSAVDSAVAIWQAVSGSAGEWGGFCVGVSSICFWERSSLCSLACAPLINSPRNGDAAEPHHLWKKAHSLPLCFICL